MKVQHFAFSEYETGIKKPDIGTQWTLNGNNNANFKKFIDAYDDSPTNNFIIKTIVNYIVGQGLTDKKGKINPHAYISKQDLRLICLDFKITGNAFIQVVNSLSKPIKIKHTPVMRMALSVNQNPQSIDFMEVNGYWYSWDWTEKYKYTPQFLPKFSGYNTFEIEHIKNISSEPFFPFPDWFSGFKSAKIESLLIDDTVNHVKNGFQGKTVINVNNGANITKDEEEDVIKKVKKDYTGTENSDGLIVSLNEDPSQAIVVDTIEPRGRNEQFVTYDETAEIKLMAAHSAMNIIFQRPGSSGFSNNADEIATATDSLYLGVINPFREVILDSFNKIFKKINPECEIDFVNFGQEEIITTDVVDDTTASAQAQLKGSVGGVQSLLEVQASYVAGTTTYESAIAILDLIFGFNREQAIRLLGNPETNE